ncbi:MAG: lipopolysaccharide core heptose(I) kinase RfaP [Pseudomonadota bacterium]
MNDGTDALITDASATPAQALAVTQQALQAGLYLREELRAQWLPANVIEEAFALQGDVFRDVPGRRTLRVRLGDRSYFVKLHYGVGWLEIVKNWLQFKRPVVGAENEFMACRNLQLAGIAAPVVAAFGRGAGSPAQRKSFVLCDELAGYTSLEDVTETWFGNPPTAHQRHRLLIAVAHFAKQFHAQGFIHRDFYICHLVIAPDVLTQLDTPDRENSPAPLAVLDLHRARQFPTIPRRWLKRDLAALLFSTLDLGYSRADWLRFVRLYSGRPLRQEMRERGAFWRAVYARALRLYRKGQRKGLVKNQFQP